MPASSADKFCKVTSNTGWQLDASGISDASVTSFGLVSATSIPTDTAVILTVDRVDSSGNQTPAKMERIVGVMSGTTVTSCVRGLEGTAQAHSAGAVVEIVISKSNINKLMEGILAEHNADGTHKETALDSMIAGTEAQGDIIYHDGSVWNRLPKGTDGQYLKLASSIPSWAAISSDGWNVYSTVVPTRASADDPTYVLTFAGVDLTSMLSVGMRIKWTQNSTVRYAIITAISFSTNTTLTVYGGTDYDVDDTGTHTISAFYYSTMKAPLGFPLDPLKWQVIATSTNIGTQSSPAINTWYNAGTTNHQIVVPIGSWKLSYKAHFEAAANGISQMVSGTLSTTNNSESDADYTVAFETSGAAFRPFAVGYVEKHVLLAAKTTWYLNVKTSISSTSDVWIRSDQARTFIKAVCAYL